MDIQLTQGGRFVLRWIFNIGWVLISYTVFYMIFRRVELSALLTIALSDLYWQRVQR